MFSSAKDVLVVCLVFASLATTVCANAFRGHSHTRALRVKDSMRADDLRQVMMDELMVALGSDSRVTETRLQKIEDGLRPIFQSLPKNENGHLDHSVARYALHRLFVLRHGMYIKGLEPGDDGKDSASATEVLSDRVPSFLQASFEHRLNGRGLGLHELAILAATMEHVIHDHLVKVLEVAYKIQNLPLQGYLTLEQAEIAIDTYMILFVLSKDPSSITFSDIAAEWANPKAFYPGWLESKKFTRAVMAQVIAPYVAKPESGNFTFSFDLVAKVVEEIGEHYGQFQDTECKDLKSALMKIEEPGTGRVLLNNFYAKASTGNWVFTESRDYLKDMGALDDTDSARESVIIANYVNSASNCGASSGMYSICCINECEALFGRLEGDIGQPDANPDQILRLVADLPSSTVQASRTISSSLRARLQEIANHHDGRIPLHGRLFAQWMHHAYPNECPYPHMVGTTTRASADRWTNGKSLMSKEEMELHAYAQIEVNETATWAEDLMWTSEEELVISRVSTRQPLAHSRSWSFTSLAAVFSVCLVAWRLYGTSHKDKMLLPMSHKAHNC